MHKNVCILLFHFFLCWHIKERCLLLWPVAWGLASQDISIGYMVTNTTQLQNAYGEYSVGETIPLFFCLDGCWNKMAERISGLFFLGVLKTTPLRIWHSAAEGHLAWQYSIYMPNDELCAGHLIIVTYIFYISGSCKTFITSYKMLYVKHQKYKMITRIQKM